MNLKDILAFVTLHYIMDYLVTDYVLEKKSLQSTKISYNPRIK